MILRFIFPYNVKWKCFIYRLLLYTVNYSQVPTHHFTFYIMQDICVIRSKSFHEYNTSFRYIQMKIANMIIGICINRLIMSSTKIINFLVSDTVIIFKTIPQADLELKKKSLNIHIFFLVYSSPPCKQYVNRKSYIVQVNYTLQHAVL